MLRSVPGLPAASEPAQLPPITYQLPQASVWQGGPGPMGTPGQLGQLKPVELLEQEPDAFAEASPEQEDTAASQFLAWLNTAESKDTTPDVPDSPGVTAFLQVLPDLSAYVGEGSSPKEQAAVARLGDSEDTVPAVPDRTAVISELPVLSDLPNTACLDELPDLSMYAVGGDGPQNQAAVARLRDNGDTISAATVPNMPADVLEELPDLCNLASTAPSSEAPDFFGYGAQSDWPKDRSAAAMLGDADPFWGVPASPSQDPTAQQGGMAAELPTWLPPRPSETEEESSAQSPLRKAEESSAQSPREDPLQQLLDSVLLQIPLLSPLSSPPRPSRCHPPRTAQLVEEVPQGQPRVGWTHLPLGAITYRGLPRLGRRRGKQAKRPAPARGPRAQETSLQDNIPPKRRKMVEQRVGKHSKTPWEAKADRDGVAAGSSRQQAGSSKRRASDGNNMPAKRARSLRDPTGQSAARPPTASDRRAEKTWSRVPATRSLPPPAPAPAPALSQLSRS